MTTQHVTCRGAREDQKKRAGHYNGPQIARCRTGVSCGAYMQCPASAPAAPSKLDILPCLIERRPAFAAFISGSVGRGAPVAAGRASSFVGTGGRSRVGVRARRGLRLGRSRSQAWTRRRRPRTRRAIHARLAWSVRCAPPQGRRPRVWARTMAGAWAPLGAGRRMGGGVDVRSGHAGVRNPRRRHFCAAVASAGHAAAPLVAGRAVLVRWAGGRGVRVGGGGGRRGAPH